MCGIAGVALTRPINEGDRSNVVRMVSTLKHRGPDFQKISVLAQNVIGAARLAIVGEESGNQPFTTDDGKIQVVYNGEIYNHRQLRQLLQAQKIVVRSECDGAILPYLYQVYGPSFIERLEGQFAIAVSDGRDGSLTLVRDRMGICPLFWMQRPEGVYFASEVKALQAAGLLARRLNPQALVQLAYFGAICAPITPFESVYALLPAHMMQICADRTIVEQRYWQLQFPEQGQEMRPSKSAAARRLHELLKGAVASHLQGDQPVAAFLSGGIDSSVITALLAEEQGARRTQAFCATSPLKDFNEGAEARTTAEELGVGFQQVEIHEGTIAENFERLIYHTETPVISTEAVALLILAEHVQRTNKVVLTGEGADEAFGGYLAFRQQRKFGYLSDAHARPLRAWARPYLHRRFGTDVLVPSEECLRSLYEHLDFVPAQAYEWEFYRQAIRPVLSKEYRNMLDNHEQWKGLGRLSNTSKKTHWLNRSLDVAYRVLLPNYLLGPHGDRVMGAHSIEGRYPFLDQHVVEYASALHPSLKLHGSDEKYVLRHMAQDLLPLKAAWRKKKRFAMPFGTPFLQAGIPEVYKYLLHPRTLQTYGYFDPHAVEEVSRRLLHLPAEHQNCNTGMQRLELGIAFTSVVSTQLWHHSFIEKATVPCIADDVVMEDSRVR